MLTTDDIKARLGLRPHPAIFQHADYERERRDELVRSFPAAQSLIGSLTRG